MLSRLLKALALLALASSLASAQPSPGKVYTYNARGQVTSISDSAHPEADATYTYDNNGNRETFAQGGALTRYGWDARDRLVAIWRDGVLVARYRYHWNGLRSEKETFGPAATLVRYQYDGSWLESETNVIGNTLVRYTRAADGRVLAVRRNNDVRYFLSDALGTPVALMTLQGATVAGFAYDAWGNQVRHEGSENTPIRHNSQFFDEESGLYYISARYYDPKIGVFISEDLVEGDVMRPITQNRYVAFNANPTGFIDPDGRCGLATMDIHECINNVAIVNGWDAARTRQEHDMQYEAEHLAAPQKLFNTITIGLGGTALLGTARAGLAAYEVGGLSWGFFVASTRAAPLIEAGAQIGANVPGPGTIPAGTVGGAASRAEAALAQEARAASYADDVPRALTNLPDPPAFTNAVDDLAPAARFSETQAVTITEGLNPSQIPSMGMPRRTGETASTATGKSVHSRLAAERRASGDFDLVNQPLLDASGRPIQVARRVDLSTGEAVTASGHQIARPDAVRFREGVILDDKPLGRAIAKDQQEMIRFINAYAESQGRQPNTIGIQRYDPTTGLPVVTELYTPDYFQSWTKK